MDLPYLAGLIDGEGSFTLERKGPKRSRHPKITISMNDKEAVEAVAQTFGGSLTKAHYPSQKTAKYTWYIGNSAAIELTKEVLPFLVIKRRQKVATLLISWPTSGSREGNKEMRQKLFEEMKIANAYKHPTKDLDRRILTADDKSYLAAIIDGEGYVCRPREELQITSTDNELCYWCKSRFGGKVYKCTERAGYAQCWSWRRKSSHAEWWIEVAEKVQILRKREDMLVPLYV